MSDNVTVNGAIIATDDVGGGVQIQKAKINLGGDGIDAGTVAIDNPMPVVALGELIEALEAQRMSLEALAKTIGLSMPDVSGRLRIAIDAISTGLTLATVTTVGTVSAVGTVATVSNVTTVNTVTTVATVTNQAQVGGMAANQQMPALAFMAADSLRRNIQVA